MLKKTLLTVLIAVSASPLVAIAAIDGLAGAPTPVQSYHSDASNPSPTGDSGAMAQVQAIMAKAKTEAQKNQQVAVVAPSLQPSVQTAPPAPVQALAPIPPTPEVSTQNTNNANPDLAGQISTLNQANLMYQQRTDQKIEALTTQSAKLTDQLTRMGEALTIVNQEVVQLSSKLQQIRPGVAPLVQEQNLSKWEQLKPEFLNGFSYVIYAVIAALIVIILLMMPWNRRNDRRMATAGPSGVAAPNEGEYDFMGTHEAIPAKLDLARAYLAMDDHQAAGQVLAEVQKDGNADQRLEAQKMLDSIIKKS